MDKKGSIVRVAAVHPNKRMITELSNIAARAKIFLRIVDRFGPDSKPIDVAQPLIRNLIRPGRGYGGTIAFATPAASQKKLQARAKFDELISLDLKKSS